MNEYKEEFFPRDDKHHDKAYWSRIGCELACLVLAGILVSGLQGCATAKADPESKVCFMQLMGRTESGLSVVRQACLSEEDFAKLNQ